MTPNPAPAPPARSSGVSLHLLQNRNFRLFLVGSSASVTGVYAGNVVIEWLISTSNAASQAAVLLAALGILEFVPNLTLGIFAGAWADRYDRRRLMVGAQLARAGIFAGLTVLVVREGFNPIEVLGAVLALSAMGTVFGPASGAYLPRLIGAADLTSANGLLESLSTLSGFVGSPLAGGLVFLLGVGVGFLTNSVLFAASALAFAMMALPLLPSATRAPTPTAGPSQLAQVRDGLRFLRQQTALLVFAVGGMAVNFFTFYLVFIVLYTRSFLHAGADVFGLLLGANSVGYAAGALLAPRLKVEQAPGLWVAIAWGLCGLPILALVLVPSTPVAVAALAAEGLLGSFVAVTFNATVQRTVPDHLLGRFFAIDSTLSYAMIPVGLAIGGFLVVTRGVGVAFLVAGSGLLVAGLSLLLSRSVRAWGRNLDGVPRP